MSTPITPTEAHRDLVRKVANLRTPMDAAAQLIAESEARAIADAVLIEYGALIHKNKELEAERDQLRAQVALDEKAKALMLKEHFRDVDEMTKLHGFADMANKQRHRAEKAEAELTKLEAEAKALDQDLRTNNADNRALATELAALRAKPCPHVITDREGTAHCSLAERDGQAFAKEREKVRVLRAQRDRLISAGLLAADHADEASSDFYGDALNKRDAVNAFRALHKEIAATEDKP
jgi:hypothetical protein